MRCTDGKDRSRRTVALWALVAVAAAVAVLGLSPHAARAEGTQSDSDDYNCNHGAPDDPTSIEACNRLRGSPVGAGVQDIGHQRNSDDWNCNHGDPNAAATLAACQRLRGTTLGVGRDEGHLRNSDDWNCHHGRRGEPATIAACARLRGEYAVAEVRGPHAFGHVTRELATPRRVSGRTYRSVRYTLEFDCSAGLRRRVAYAYYTGRGASGWRVGGGRSLGPWLRIPRGAMPYACR
ncbi:MAG TPA: surface-adhesin E family protein [Caulobacteraceae bacterium]|jgi:hypothetical protein|nr:surface-adhesin E family protein [Caulobacteraceae bacterium]